MRNHEELKLLVKYALLIAMTTVMTMVIQIPTINTNGYLNLGDMVVFVAAFLLGKRGGLIVGGLGSGLADILLGYSHYAPITLIVKGLEGFIAGAILETKVGKRVPLLATVLGAMWMALGYYLAEIFMYGKEPALLGIPGNLAQGLFGAITCLIFIKALNKTRIKI
ncbi:MAG: ECF transporter S component [Tissierellia bacterium]|nr:ECF transporter S component [Tissierellia bacterium]MDD4726136.1 ECF transporter S component [Tissierellia bacterium]